MKPVELFEFIWRMFDMANILPEHTLNDVERELKITLVMNEGETIAPVVLVTAYQYLHNEQKDFTQIPKDTVIRNKVSNLIRSTDLMRDILDVRLTDEITGGISFPHDIDIESEVNHIKIVNYLDRLYKDNYTIKKDGIN